MKNARLTAEDVSRLMVVNSLDRKAEDYAAPTHYWAHPKMMNGHVVQMTALRKSGPRRGMMLRMDGVSVLRIDRGTEGFIMTPVCETLWASIKAHPGFLNHYPHVDQQGVDRNNTYKNIRSARAMGWWILERMARLDVNVLSGDEPVQESASDVPAEPDSTPITGGRRNHKAVAEVLRNVEEGCDNIWMVGPAGTGKTTIATSVSEALNLPMGMLAFSEGTTESHLFGRILPNADGSWTYKPSRFVEIYEQGGVFLLDELDAADPNVLVGVNAALDNGMLVDPEGNIRRRHPNTVILAAANTYGTGASAEYVGRNQLDSATLDRFVLATVNVDYDPQLERAIAFNVLQNAVIANAVVEVVEMVRGAVREQGLKRVVSMRFTRRACLKIKAGRTMSECLSLLTAGWNQSDMAVVMDRVKPVLRSLDSSITRQQAAA